MKEGLAQRHSGTEEESAARAGVVIGAASEASLPAAFVADGAERMVDGLPRLVDGHA